MAISPPLTGEQLDLWTSSPEGSPVRTFPSRGLRQGLAGSAAGYGQNTPALLAKYDPATSSWRTSQLCLDGDFHEFSETWPRSGMTRNGIAYQLALSGLHTFGIESGSLPTPTASDGAQGSILCQVTPDQTTGKPRKVNRNGQTWSAGLGRLFRMATGAYPMPKFWEWMMGYPPDWTALKDSEMPSSRRSSRKSPAPSLTPQE